MRVHARKGFSLVELFTVLLIIAVDTYTNDVSALNFTPSPLVTITFVEADSVGWSAKATHANDTSSCAVYYGQAAVLAPATSKTIIGCN